MVDWIPVPSHDTLKTEVKSWLIYQQVEARVSILAAQQGIETMFLRNSFDSLREKSFIWALRVPSGVVTLVNNEMRRVLYFLWILG